LAPLPKPRSESFMSHKLKNYLRTHRRRYALSQEDLAFLLGIKSRTTISHYEMFQRVPDLKTALTLQAVFGTPVVELFAGIYEQIEKETAKRARILLEREEGTASGRRNSRKDLLRAIVITPDINKENP